MPKITSISSRPLRSCNPLSPEDSKLNTNAVYIDTSPVWNGQETQKFYDITQDAVFLNAAMQRMMGSHKLRLPVIDQFQAQGRTIYNAGNHIQDDTTLPSKAHTLLYKKTLEVMTEPHTPPRRAALKPQSKPHPYQPRRRTRSPKNDDPLGLSTRRRQRHQEPQTLFLAITETNEVQLIPDRSILPTAMDFKETGYISDSSETSNRSGNSMDRSFEGGSRSPTPSLSWSDSVNSSPRFDPTIDWNEGFDGPAREAIIPIHYGTTGCEPPDSDDECTEVEEPLGHLFHLFINTEDCPIF